MSDFTPGVYKDINGKLYKLIALGRLDGTCDEYVIYQEVYGNREFFVRPKDSWNEEIENAETGKKVKRFVYVRQD